MLRYMPKDFRVSDNRITWRDEIPYNTDYEDVYYSTENGLEESRHVYLDGINLAELAERKGSLVRIGELGFGAGLNFLATAQQWLSCPDAPVLHYISIEKYPLSVADMQRAHQKFPQIADLSIRLSKCLSTRLSGLQRVWFARNILLDVWFGDVAEVLPQLNNAIDAWYLDGFSPKTNPEMFNAEICQHLARLSVPNARVATFSVAGMVRRNLAEVGFEVAKVPGFGRKGQCLQARYNPQKTYFSKQAKQNIAIIGAGIAGASCAEQSLRLGHRVSVFSASANYASEVPIAAVAPRLSANPTPRGRDIARCFAYAVPYYQQYPEAIISVGALKVPSAAFSLERLRSACTGWNGLGDHAARMCSPDQARTLSGVIMDTEVQYLPSALSLDTAKLLAILLQGAERINANITSFLYNNSGWQLSDAEGKVYSGFDAVIIAAGAGIRSLMPELAATTQIKTGEIQYYQSATAPKIALGGWGSHLLPGNSGFWLGKPKNAENILAHWNIQGDAQQDWHAEKLSIRGHWPLCGAVAGQEGLYVLAGAGGHGYTLMPLLASDIALQI